MRHFRKVIIREDKPSHFTKPIKPNKMRFSELTYQSKTITSYDFEFTFTKDATEYIISGEYEAKVYAKHDPGTYWQPPETEVDIDLDIDLDSLEIYDMTKDEESNMIPSKEMIAFIEDCLTDYIDENYQDFE